MAMDREVLRLRRSIANSGPDTLLVCVGPTSHAVSDEDLDWARGLIMGIVKRQQERLPLIKKVIVTRFHPLTLERSTEADMALPTFNIDDMDGTLIDANGHRALPARARLLLNAAVVLTTIGASV
jgi:hypothetical protein